MFQAVILLSKTVDQTWFHEFADQTYVSYNCWCPADEHYNLSATAVGEHEDETESNSSERVRGRWSIETVEKWFTFHLNSFCWREDF